MIAPNFPNYHHCTVAHQHHERLFILPQKKAETTRKIMTGERVISWRSGWMLGNLGEGGKGKTHTHTPAQDDQWKKAPAQRVVKWNEPKWCGTLIIPRTLNLIKPVFSCFFSVFVAVRFSSNTCFFSTIFFSSFSFFQIRKPVNLYTWIQISGAGLARFFLTVGVFSPSLVSPLYPSPAMSLTSWKWERDRSQNLYGFGG